MSVLTEAIDLSKKLVLYIFGVALFEEKKLN